MELDTKAKGRLEVLKQVINKKMSKKEAAIKLEITYRQFSRILKSYLEHGEEALIHKNCGKESHNKKKISSTLIEEIEFCYLNEYADYNFSHFYEEQGINFGVSFSTMVNIFNRDDIISPLAQHKTIKLYNDKMRKATKSESLTTSQQTLFNQRQKEYQEKHIRKSTLNYSFGQEVQMDAAFWFWFNEEETALHLAVDKATKKVLYGIFDYEETTKAYLILLMNVILNYGIPNKIKTDKRNSFSVNNARSSKTKLNLTQFGRICEDLEIALTCSSDPLFKPNVERENGTFKRRLKAELRHANIKSLEEANKYLNEIFIPKINKRFSYDINPNKNVMRANDYSNDELNIIISIQSERTIDNASSIKYFNKYYLPIDLETGEVMSFNSGTKCIVINSYNKDLYAIIEEKLYFLYLVEKQDDYIKKPASKNGYKPSPNHPWKTNMMLK